MISSLEILLGRSVYEPHNRARTLRRVDHSKALHVLHGRSVIGEHTERLADTHGVWHTDFDT